jgi:hypothetical protein
VPVLGGLLIADEVVDIFLPVRFYWVRRARWLKLQKERAEAAVKETAEHQQGEVGLPDHGGLESPLSHVSEVEG